MQSNGQLPGVAAPAPPVLSSNSVIVISDSEEEEEKENRAAGTSRPGRGVLLSQFTIRAV